MAVRSVIRYYEAKAADSARAEQARREAQARLVAGNPQLNAFTPIGGGGGDTFRSPYDFSGGGKQGRNGRPSSARTAPPLAQMPAGMYVSREGLGAGLAPTQPCQVGCRARGDTCGTRI